MGRCGSSSPLAGLLGPSPAVTWGAAALVPGELVSEEAEESLAMMTTFMVAVARTLVRRRSSPVPVTMAMSPNIVGGVIRGAVMSRPRRVLSRDRGGTAAWGERAPAMISVSVGFPT